MHLSQETGNILLNSTFPFRAIAFWVAIGVEQTIFSCGVPANSVLPFAVFCLLCKPMKRTLFICCLAISSVHSAEYRIDFGDAAFDKKTMMQHIEMIARDSSSRWQSVKITEKLNGQDRKSMNLIYFDVSFKDEIDMGKFSSEIEALSGIKVTMSKVAEE